MRMFTGSGNTRKRLGAEAYFETMHTEDLFDEDTCKKLIVSCLKCIGIVPVDLELFHDVLEITGIRKVCLYAADFLVAHLRLKAVKLKEHDGLLKRSTDNTLGALPVLFLEALGCREDTRVDLFFRRAYPEFQLGGRGQLDACQIVYGEAQLFTEHRVFAKVSFQFGGESVCAALQDRTRADFIAVMDEEGRDTESTDRKIVFRS